MNYLLIFKYYRNMVSINFLFNFFKSILILFVAYNVPIIIFEKVINISDINTINTISAHIYTFLYKVPAFLVLYTFIGTKVIRRINIITNKSTINPVHIYIVFLINVSYFLLTLLGNTFKIGYYLEPILNILIYSLYFSEFVYPYIDNNVYNYNNFVDFYNNNIIYFSIISTIYVSIDYYLIPESIYLLGLFIYSVLISPILLSINYNKYNSNCISYYNLFYPFEIILSYIISISSLILLDKLTKRNIQIK